MDRNRHTTISAWDVDIFNSSRKETIISCPSFTFFVLDFPKSGNDNDIQGFHASFKPDLKTLLFSFALPRLYIFCRHSIKIRKCVADVY